MELVIAGIIMSVIAMVALPSFKNMLERAYCKNAQMNLIAIYSAARNYKIAHRTYLNPSGHDIAAIRSDLKLSIDDPKFTYDYAGAAGTFSASASRTTGNYTCFILDSAVSATNPNCTDTTICGTNYLAQ